MVMTQLNLKSLRCMIALALARKKGYVEIVGMFIRAGALDTV
jgi:hypothetical protein